MSSSFAQLMLRVFRTVKEATALSRIDTAQHLLRVTDKSIEEICSLVGYSDTAAFYKAFKLHTGTTPFKYRKRSK